MEKIKRSEWWQRTYTRVIGIAFLFVVLSLVLDYIAFGFRAETMHKIFHVLLGVIVVYFGWSNKDFWRPFCLANGAFFAYVALFGLLFRNFGGLDTFNNADTLLHSIVGLSGLIIGLFGGPIKRI